MKLVLCPECGDIFNLRDKGRDCTCKAVSGYYLEDGLHAVVHGPGICLGFANLSFHEAMAKYNNKAWGENFEAFVIPFDCSTIEMVDKDNTVQEEYADNSRKIVGLIKSNMERSIHLLANLKEEE